MKFSLFKRSSRQVPPGPNAPGKDDTAVPLSSALPEAQDLTVTLHLEGQQPFKVDLHDMNIQGAEIILPFHLAPLGGEGEVVQLTVEHRRDGWLVTAIGCVRRVEKCGSAKVLLELQFTQLGDLYAQLDDALGRYFNRRSAARVKPEIEMNVRVKLSYGHHRLRGVAHDLSLTGLGVVLPLVQAAVFRSGERVKATIDIPGIAPEFEGPGIVKHGYRSGENVVLGVEFDLLADSPMRNRRAEYLKYVEGRRDAIEAWQRQLSRPA